MIISINEEINKINIDVSKVLYQINIDTKELVEKRKLLFRKYSF